MEIRVLQYFLAVAREQNISAAAEALHLSQPTLSRQLKDMENDLGKQLFIRGNRKITLTEEGMFLRKRAEEIIDLVKKTENELMVSDDVVAGDIYIGAGETDAIRLIAKAARNLQDRYPQVCFHILSGNAEFVMERLDKGLIDFGLIFAPVDRSKYDYFSVPAKDLWGVLMRRDSPLAKMDSIRPQDLYGKPLIVSAQRSSDELSVFVKSGYVVATYNLIYNASRMVDEGMGYAITFDKLINTSGNSNLCFVPLSPKIEARMNFIWKRYQVFSKAATLFLQELQKIIGE